MLKNHIDNQCLFILMVFSRLVLLGDFGRLCSWLNLYWIHLVVPLCWFIRAYPWFYMVCISGLSLIASITWSRTKWWWSRVALPYGFVCWCMMCKYEQNHGLLMDFRYTSLQLLDKLLMQRFCFAVVVACDTALLLLLVVLASSSSYPCFWFFG
jgi:hypothetical protein